MDLATLDTVSDFIKGRPGHPPGLKKPEKGQLPVPQFGRVAHQPLHHGRYFSPGGRGPFAIVNGDGTSISHGSNGGEDGYADSVQIGNVRYPGNPGGGQFGLG